MLGIIGKKVGMTSVFSEEGKNIPCTVIEAGPCVVTQIRTEDKDGYTATQIAFDDVSEKSAEAGRGQWEFRTDGSSEAFEVGAALTVDRFAAGQFVDVTGTSKGKGFQGGVKRWVLEVLDKQLMVSIIE